MSDSVSPEDRVWDDDEEDAGTELILERKRKRGEKVQERPVYRVRLQCPGLNDLRVERQKTVAKFIKSVL